eukprot:CAMPEP_0185855574 /NCGR_PEP_ID=MMETSP1354-20130828/26137_1 /TAXON_ID=708628 /ORGANISM="Erythrolobus madagascarensis, Strain CCMP3276" /LENGTH=42 /DNA_ID= /DNA_START= /DNA_END= /DNA_ORIENTATION=
MNLILRRMRLCSTSSTAATWATLHQLFSASDLVPHFTAAVSV